LAQAVSSRHLTAEARGRSQVIPCEIVVTVEEVLGQVFLQLIYFPLPVSYPPMLSTHLYLHVALTRRNVSIFSKSGSILQESTLTL